MTVVADTPVGIAEDAEQLLDLHAIAREADYAVTRLLTTEAVQASLDAHDEHDRASEAFRRKYFPRRHRVVAVYDQVFTVSPAGLSICEVHRSARVLEAGE